MVLEFKVLLIKDFFFRWLVEIRMHFCNISMTKGTQQKISARTSIFRFLASTTESTLTEAVDLFPINGSSRGQFGYRELLYGKPVF